MPVRVQRPAARPDVRVQFFSKFRTDSQDAGGCPQLPAALRLQHLPGAQLLCCAPAGIYGSQGRADFTVDDVEHYFNYMGMLAVEGTYDRMEEMLSSGTCVWGVTRACERAATTGQHRAAGTPCPAHALVHPHASLRASSASHLVCAVRWVCIAAGLDPVDVLLLMAASENDTPKVEELLAAGANINIADNKGKSPVDLATKPEVKDMLEVRAERGLGWVGAHTDTTGQQNLPPSVGVTLSRPVDPAPGACCAYVVADRLPPRRL